MLEGGLSIADIENANDEKVVQQQQPATSVRKKWVIAIASVALVGTIAATLSIKTKRPEVEDNVDTQANKFLKRNRRGDSSLVPSVAPPDLSLASNPPTVTKQDCAIGGFCTEEGSTCAIGEESCCGETFNSIQCNCSNGMWMCMATDACYRPDGCEDYNTTAPTAAHLSSCDYSDQGTFCSIDDDCTCGDVCLDSPYDDFSVCGCEVGTTNGCDPDSDKPFCFKGFTVSGVDCGCRDDDDCGEGETCGTSWCVADIVPHCSADHNALCPPTQSPVDSETAPPTIANVITEDPSLEPSISPSENVTSVPTQKPTSTPQPTETVTTITTSQPTNAVTTISTSQPTGNLATSEPTQMVTTPLTIESTEESTSNVTNVDTVETTSVTDINIVEPATYCVNIKFISDNFPQDNGFTFLSKETGEILLEEEAGFMTESQTEYTSQICGLDTGIYTLVVTDEGGDGMFANGKGSFTVDIDGTVILVGGRFRKREISHDISVGFDASNNMSEIDQAFLDAHNSRREEFHESQGVTFRPMAWSPELAAGASAWAKKRAKMCSTDNIETGPYGQNFASQKLVGPEVARSPEDILGWWMNTFDPEQSTWGRNLQPGSAVMWRSALYVGCAAEIAPIENCPDTERACYCQVTNCRYVRTTNCAVKNKNWLDSVLDDNGTLCSTVFCPGADANGGIVEGPCHA